MVDPFLEALPNALRSCAELFAQEKEKLISFSHVDNEHHRTYYAGAIEATVDIIGKFNEAANRADDLIHDSTRDNAKALIIELRKWLEDKARRVDEAYQIDRSKFADGQRDLYKKSLTLSLFH